MKGKGKKKDFAIVFFPFVSYNGKWENTNDLYICIDLLIVNVGTAVILLFGKNRFLWNELVVESG